jgi:hypothetical protein
MPATTLPCVQPTRLDYDSDATLEFFSRHAFNSSDPNFATTIQQFVTSWATLHDHRLELRDRAALPGTAFAVRDDFGRTCPMHTQRFTDTLEVLSRNWQKYRTFSEHDLSLVMRRLEITSFAELDFGEPLGRIELALAAD